MGSKRKNWTTRKFQQLLFFYFKTFQFPTQSNKKFLLKVYACEKSFKKSGIYIALLTIDYFLSLQADCGADWDHSPFHPQTRFFVLHCLSQGRVCCRNSMPWCRPSSTPVQVKRCLLTLFNKICTCPLA